MKTKDNTIYQRRRRMRFYRLGLNSTGQSRVRAARVQVNPEPAAPALSPVEAAWRASGLSSNSQPSLNE